MQRKVKVVDRSMDPLNVAGGEAYRVLFENEKVRVLELRLKPGAKMTMHSHPAVVAYSFGDAKNKWTLPDDKTLDNELKAGQVIWSEPFTHAAENTGNTETHLLVVELKTV
jgi:quercetin dioxygenase-like cupin family protein